MITFGLVWLMLCLISLLTLIRWMRNAPAAEDAEYVHEPETDSENDYPAGRQKWPEFSASAPCGTIEGHTCIDDIEYVSNLRPITRPEPQENNYGKP